MGALGVLLPRGCRTAMGAAETVRNPSPDWTALSRTPGVLLTRDRPPRFLTPGWHTDASGTILRLATPPLNADHFHVADGQTA